MYKIIASENSAKRAVYQTQHGEIQTPVFMNVATAAAVKGGLDAGDLRNIGCQVALCNTYHLHLRPGEDIVRSLGGLRGFMGWNGPVLTDSGGFQVFSLSAMRKIKEEGVYFSSHIDGKKIFMGPEESMEIQAKLWATIVMAFDECAPYPATREYMVDSVNRTTRWLVRSKNHLDKLNSKQILFGINQGGVFKDIRIEHAKKISELDLDGYALGGLAVGEPIENMYEILENTVPFLPKNKPTYLMGVGTPENILESVSRGIDFFDCVLPARNGRHGHLFTLDGKINITNKQFEKDNNPIDVSCECSTCKNHSRAYLRHLFKSKELLALRLAVIHNLFFYNKLMADIRASIENGRFTEYKNGFLMRYSSK